MRTYANEADTCELKAVVTPVAVIALVAETLTALVTDALALAVAIPVAEIVLV